MNKHLTHVEEAVLFGGQEGAQRSVNMFYGLLTGDTHLTMKVDGSPAIVCGRDPADGRFFVSTKSFFNATPILYKSFADIARLADIGLSAKLQYSFSYLQHLEFDGYLQGDFISGPLEMDYNYKLDCFTAQPNTLVYGFDCEYDYVIAFHTHYDYDLKPTFDYDFSTLKHPSPDVLLMETRAVPYIPDVDWSCITRLNTIDMEFANRLAAHPSMPKLVTQFFNTKVRSGVTLSHPEMLAELAVWIYARYQIAIEKLKTEDAKARKRAELWSCQDFFSKLNWPKFIALLSFIHDLTVLKQDCINRLDKSSKIKTWVIRDNEYVPTGPEGYVMSRGGEAYKLVDRTKFSFYNFSPNFVKGWDKPTRT